MYARDGGEEGGGESLRGDTEATQLDEENLEALTGRR